MARGHPALSRAYALLKTEVLAGAMVPGTLLVERQLATRFGTSVTPLRSAAWRLVGERLLEPAPEGGFRLPRLTAHSASDLYAFHGQVLRVAIRSDRAGHRTAALSLPLPLSDEGDLTHRTTALFDALAHAWGSPEQHWAVRSAGERLQGLRRREALVLGGLETELQAVADATAKGCTSDLLTALWAYHRRRLRRIEALVLAAYAPLAPGGS